MQSPRDHNNSVLECLPVLTANTVARSGSDVGCVALQLIDRSNQRMVLLGKSGTGKSSLTNTILGEDTFKINHSPVPGTSLCQAKSNSVNGRSITLIDTPGFFGTGRSDEEMRPEIVSCITECAPGPHAFLIVLKMQKFTEQERAIIAKICQSFSEDALNYSVIVFTHGDQLPEGMEVKDFIGQNKNLSDLVKKCGGRCHVFDNKYWKSVEKDSYRSNQFQVEELLKTVDKMIEVNEGSYYTNDTLKEVRREIQRGEERIRQTSTNMSHEEIQQKAKFDIFNWLLIRSAGVATGALLGALLGATSLVLEGKAGAMSDVLCGMGKGALRGYDAAEGAKSPGEAVQRTMDAVRKDIGVPGITNNK
ncbi:GTPase IMAP family member 7-like [Cheilinus undulatus]|uniref:GTPase IMAP family member 7-like n=1 Tax=Cheilinus undulatus TaxID=241271 RepID=UPI001BD45E07|nr:GTPase IMAP family member 7-like [Cheilinus undulatus]